MTHLLIRGIGLCGAAGQIEVTLVPEEATCPSCCVLIAMLREKERNAEVPMARKSIGRLKLRRRSRRALRRPPLR